MKTKSILAVLLTLALATPALAGWVIEEANTDSSGEQTIDTVYFQKNKAKVVSPRQTMIFDIDKGVMSFVVTERKVYWTGTPEEFQRGMKAGSDRMMEERMKQIPPEQRQAYEKYMKQMKAKDQASPAKREFNVEVKKTSDKVTISGYSGQKYQVIVDGMLKEELWVCDKIDITGEGDREKFRKLTDSMSEPGQGDSYRSSPEYVKISQYMEKGYPVKRMHYDESGNETYGSEMKKIEKKNIPGSEFEVPKGYKKLSINEFVSMMMQGGGR